MGPLLARRLDPVLRVDDMAELYEPRPSRVDFFLERTDAQPDAAHETIPGQESQSRSPDSRSRGRENTRQRPKDTWEPRLGTPKGRRK